MKKIWLCLIIIVLLANTYASKENACSCGTVYCNDILYYEENSESLCSKEVHDGARLKLAEFCGFTGYDDDTKLEETEILPGIASDECEFSGNSRNVESKINELSAIFHDAANHGDSVWVKQKSTFNDKRNLFLLTDRYKFDDKKVDQSVEYILNQFMMKYVNAFFEDWFSGIENIRPENKEILFKNSRFTMKKESTDEDRVYYWRRKPSFTMIYTTEQDIIKASTVLLPMTAAIYSTDRIFFFRKLPDIFYYGPAQFYETKQKRNDHLKESKKLASRKSYPKFSIVLNYMTGKRYLDNLNIDLDPKNNQLALYYSITAFLVEKCGKENFFIFASHNLDENTGDYNSEKTIDSLTKIYGFKNYEDLEKAWEKWIMSMDFDEESFDYPESASMTLSYPDIPIQIEETFEAFDQICADERFDTDSLGDVFQELSSKKYIFNENAYTTIANVKSRNTVTHDGDMIVSTPSYFFSDDFLKYSDKFLNSISYDWVGVPYKDIKPFNAKKTYLYLIFKLDHNLAPGVANAIMSIPNPPSEGYIIWFDGEAIDIFSEAVSHEMHHVMAFSYFFMESEFKSTIPDQRAGIPAFVFEGGASMAESIYKQKKEYQNRLKENLNNIFSFDEMFNTPFIARDEEMKYAQSHAMVVFFVELCGKKRFMRFVKDGSISKDWDKELRRHYGFQNKFQAEKIWKQWLSAYYFQDKWNV